ncbi:MAG: hypothetical protein GY928_21510 [Colwellia sp.]|nr:hypothetical protein [Colwellia sp.]
MHEKKGNWKGSMEITEELRREIAELKEENARLKRRIDMFESGSNKSALNIHKKGKRNLQRYIDTHHYRGTPTGAWIRNLIDRVEPYSYAQIIEGKF